MYNIIESLIVAVGTVALSRVIIGILAVALPGIGPVIGAYFAYKIISSVVRSVLVRRELQRLQTEGVTPKEAEAIIMAAWKIETKTKEW